MRNVKKMARASKDNSQTNGLFQLQCASLIVAGVEFALPHVPPHRSLAQ